VTTRGLVLAALFVPGLALAQNPTNPQAQPPIIPDSIAHPRPNVRRDTTRTDTTKKELVTWAEPDSMMNLLLNRPGFSVTRYQGQQATFDATHRSLQLSGKSAVQRDQTILVADSIFYNDSAKTMRAAAAPGDTIVLRDPAQGSADVIALGSMAYDLVHHRGIVTQVSTSTSQTGQTWYLHGGVGAFQGDTSAQGANTQYAEDASITSCDLPNPHYHFQAKEIKVISKHIMVARPAVLYIADIPVMWLPFIFQDMRSGRRSGIIPPRFGLSDIVRSSPNFHRELDNLGYYFNLGNYMDATVSLDWRSGTGAAQGDVGWTRYNGEWRYRWLDRFMTGGVRASYSTFSSGERSLGLSWSHQQQFSQTSTLNANINYSSNTTAIRQQAYTVAQALASIASAVNYQQQMGPLSFSLGGTRTQHTGRDEVDQSFPNFSMTSKPLNVTPWLLWTPQLSVNNTQNLHMDGAPFRFVPVDTGPGFDSVQVNANQRNSTLNFQTPLRILGFNWQNSFTINDRENDFPQTFDIRDFDTGALLGHRVYAKSYLTAVDWQTGISLPALLQSSLKISPFISIVNADPTGPFWVRSQLSGGQFVHQSKTLQYGVSASPTLFGFFPGFGPFTRIRHSIEPQISFGYSPAAKVSDEFLKAQNRTRSGYLGGISRSTISLTLNQTIEGKLKSKSDTNPNAGEKIKLLSLAFSPLTYDFERAKQTHGTGLTSTSFSYRVASDLLPGFDLSVDYSLYQGDVQSDTARFKPFRTGITASFTLGKKNNPFTTIARIFGGAPESTTVAPNPSAQYGEGIYQQPNIAGPGGAAYPYPTGIPTGAGWNTTVSFSAQRSRPVIGARIFDPRTVCQPYLDDAIRYQACVNAQSPVDTLQQTIAGGQSFITPAQATLRASTSLSLTPNWAMSWTTGYDFERHEFSDQNVSLQRDMHDWRALFGFTRAPNGNFAFNFFIALKAEPDLKFDYNRSTARPVTSAP